MMLQVLSDKQSKAYQDELAWMYSQPGDIYQIAAILMDSNPDKGGSGICRRPAMEKAAILLQWFMDRCAEEKKKSGKI
jgi:hypothetical protein